MKFLSILALIGAVAATTIPTNYGECKPKTVYKDKVVYTTVYKDNYLPPKTEYKTKTEYLTKTETKEIPKSYTKTETKTVHVPKYTTTTKYKEKTIYVTKTETKTEHVPKYTTKYETKYTTVTKECGNHGYQPQPY